MPPSLSVILPCYNEEDAIPAVINELLQFRNHCLQQSLFSNIQIIVVDDGSTDGGMRLLDNFPDVQVLGFETNRGYGAALKAGIEASHGDWVGFYDLDNTCHPEDILSIHREMLKSEPKMFCGVRLTSSSKMPVMRKAGNTIFKILVSFLMGRKIQDACSGFRFFHRSYCDVYVKNLPNQLNFTLAMSVFTLRNKLNYQEFPIRYTERRGRSKLSAVRDGILFLATILKYRLGAGLKLP